VRACVGGGDWWFAGLRGESELLQEFRANLQKKNKLLRSFIGMGYYGTITPAVIQRYARVPLPLALSAG
jgi:hypothetical protein